MLIEITSVLGSLLGALLVLMLSAHMAREKERADESHAERETFELVLRELVRAMDRSHPEVTMRLPPGW